MAQNRLPRLGIDAKPVHEEPSCEAGGFPAPKLEAVLARQNEDGGFGDARDGALRLDGWVRGYAEPQGISNTFATWFRVLTIAHIARVPWPAWRRWRSRGMVGIGCAP